MSYVSLLACLFLFWVFFSFAKRSKSPASHSSSQQNDSPVAFPLLQRHKRKCTAESIDTFVCEVNCQTRFPGSLLTFSDSTCLSPKNQKPAAPNLECISVLYEHLSFSFICITDLNCQYLERNKKKYECFHLHNRTTASSLDFRIHSTKIVCIFYSKALKCCGWNRIENFCHYNYTITITNQIVNADYRTCTKSLNSKI